jgi:hypothetical protein
MSKIKAVNVLDDLLYMAVTPCVLVDDYYVSLQIL